MRPKDHFILNYRLPYLSMLAFLQDLATVMEGHLTILGNLNIKINNNYDSNSMLLLDTLDSFYLSNKVTLSTQPIKHHQLNHIGTAQ